MRRLLPRLALVALCLVLPRRGHADDYRDFRVPDYRLLSWNLDLTGTGSASRFAPSGGTDNRSTLGRFEFRSPFQADDVTESRERFISLNLQSSPLMQTGQSTGGSLSPGSSFEFRGIERDYAGQANWFESRYPGANALAWNWGASFYARMIDQDNADDYFRVAPGGEEHLSYQNRRTTYFYTGSASLGLGRGRVRDVSGVYEAQVLESRLLETGRLLRPLTPGGRQRLAELFYLSDGITSVHDRPSKYLWTEIERVLAADGALQDGTLDAWSALRALEPVMLLAGSNRRAGRFVGLFGFASADRGHQDTQERQESTIIQNGVIVSYYNLESSSRTDIEQDDAGVGLEWSENHPLSMRSQLDLRSRLKWGSHETLSGLFILGMRHMIADRWDAELVGQYDATAWTTGGQRSEPDWFVTARGTLAYLIEDSWSLQASYQTFHSQSRERDLPAYQLADHEITLGVTYRAAGRFGAPAAGLASRPMVGGR